MEFTTPTPGASLTPPPPVELSLRYFSTIFEDFEFAAPANRAEERRSRRSPTRERAMNIHEGSKLNYMARDMVIFRARLFGAREKEIFARGRKKEERISEVSPTNWE